MPDTSGFSENFKQTGLLSDWSICYICLIKKITVISVIIANAHDF